MARARAHTYASDGETDALLLCIHVFFIIFHPRTRPIRSQVEKACVRRNARFNSFRTTFLFIYFFPFRRQRISHCPKIFCLKYWKSSPFPLPLKGRINQLVTTRDVLATVADFTVPESRERKNEIHKKKTTPPCIAYTDINHDDGQLNAVRAQSIKTIRIN